MITKDSKITRVRIYADGVSERPRQDLGKLLAREIRIEPKSGNSRHAIIAAQLPEGQRSAIKSAVRKAKDGTLRNGRKIGFGWEKSVYLTDGLAIGVYTYENLHVMLGAHIEEQKRSSEIINTVGLEWKRPIVDRLRHAINRITGHIEIERARKQLPEENRAAEAGIPAVPTYYAEAGVGIITPFMNYPTAQDLIEIRPELAAEIKEQLIELQKRLIASGVLEEIHYKNIFMRYNEDTGRTEVVGLVDILGIGENRIKKAK